MCDLNKAGLLNLPSWPTNKKRSRREFSPYYSMGWSKPVVVPEYNMTIQYFEMMEVVMQHCGERLMAAARSQSPHATIEKIRNSVCVEFIDHLGASPEYDVIITNGILTHYSDVQEVETDTERVFASLDAAVANGKQAIFFSRPAAHHKTTGHTGVWEDHVWEEHTDPVRGDDYCICTPIKCEAGEDLKAVHAIRERHPEVFVMPMFELTRHKWRMHMAYSKSRGGGKMVCDCLHSCYDPAVWETEIFPVFEE
eukprot:gene12114-14316_t